MSSTVSPRLDQWYIMELMPIWLSWIIILERCSDLAVFVILQQLLKVDLVIVHNKRICYRVLAHSVSDTFLISTIDAVFIITCLRMIPSVSAQSTQYFLLPCLR